MSLHHNRFYSYLNLENTKTLVAIILSAIRFYSYLNLENTKTHLPLIHLHLMFYSYLNLENTKTRRSPFGKFHGFIVT